MHRLTWFLSGAIAVVLLGGVGSFLFLKAGAAGFSAAVCSFSFLFSQSSTGKR